MARNVVKNDTLFVNMNHTKNRQLINEFGLKTVPALINENGLFSNETAMNLMGHMKFENGSHDSSTVPAI